MPKQSKIPTTGSPSHTPVLKKKDHPPIVGSVWWDPTRSQFYVVVTNGKSFKAQYATRQGILETKSSRGWVSDLKNIFTDNLKEWCSDNRWDYFGRYGPPPTEKEPTLESVWINEKTDQLLVVVVDKSIRPIRYMAQWVSPTGELIAKGACGWHDHPSKVLAEHKDYSWLHDDRNVYFASTNDKQIANSDDVWQAIEDVCGG